ncbi:hypothetical protein ALC62_04470, partial [Cyphomyrmex costatus]
RTRELLAMGKAKLRSGIGLLTGHMPLRAHLFNLELAEQKECRLYGEESEDKTCTCCVVALHSLVKDKSWGNMFMTPKDLENAKVSSLISLVNDTKLGSTEWPTEQVGSDNGTSWI